MKIFDKNIYLIDFIPPIFLKVIRCVRANKSKESKNLLKNKITPPSDKVKQNTVKEYASMYEINVFVETGTYLGDMINAVKKIFAQIYSIELSKELYERAQEWFSEYDHIHLINGDSGEIFPDVLSEIKEPCLFWLDGHFSGGITAKGELTTPIIKELEGVFSRSYDDVILIDDARLFTGLDDYPSIEYIRSIVARHRPGWQLEVRDDIIRIHKK